MAKPQSSKSRFPNSLCTLISISAFSFISFLYWPNFPLLCHSNLQTMQEIHSNKTINLLSLPSAWNHLSFPSLSQPPPRFLKVALFVKKWPSKNHAGGMERHALTLYLALARRGHELHIFTTNPPNSSFPKYSFRNLHFHLSRPTPAGSLDQATVWKQFQLHNSTGKQFDVVHSESVGLKHPWSRNVPNLAVSWHGIAYESIHSDIIQELVRNPDEPQAKAWSARLARVTEEIRFFPSYAHHIATSDHAGDILKNVYMLPEKRVHVILNGVDENVFKPDASLGKEFRAKVGIDTELKPLVFGMAGRLVKDKGHPLMYEALRQMFAENSTFQASILVLVAGDGPWGDRYRGLGDNVVVLGPLERPLLAGFYNTIDVLVHPTLRAQGFDQILLEAMLCGKTVMGTRLASITGSVIVGKEVGYTFQPKVDSLKVALYEVWVEGRESLKVKGEYGRRRGLELFSATKMVAAYERLFLCISSNGLDSDGYCTYKYNS